MLSKKQKYLQIALNSNLHDARYIISKIPKDQRIIFEAGTPLIKEFGSSAISRIKFWSGAYVVADLKCMDRGDREVQIAKRNGADAAVALGTAPIETLNSFIENCEKYQIDSMIDMMNIDFSLSVIRKLKTPPMGIIIHRGVDEEKYNREKELLYHEIARIKNEYDVFISIAGGDDFKEVERAIFNDADIVVLWKEFYNSSNNITDICEKFLREIR